MTDERIKEERNKTAKIIVARLCGSLEATPLNISMIETVLVEYEIKITRAAERLSKIEALEEVKRKTELKKDDYYADEGTLCMNVAYDSVIDDIDSMIAVLKEEGE